MIFNIFLLEKLKKKRLIVNRWNQKLKRLFEEIKINKTVIYEFYENIKWTFDLVFSPKHKKSNLIKNINRFLYRSMKKKKKNIIFH